MSGLKLAGGIWIFAGLIALVWGPSLIQAWLNMV